ncbi:hypothetical protein Bca52824_057087 [Brassica carinata]|uniref:Uncharacterized protein n=1 Tax=Brassica carinata TaxID=52824 RepID=A0A8X7UDC5_BRACI|nr:hypothetical protein Bca52824_057087 [Brassica carinata]
MAICPHHRKSPVAVYFNDSSPGPAKWELRCNKASSTRCCCAKGSKGHSKGYLHRDINPDEFPMGLGRISNKGVFIGGSLIGGDQQQGGLPIGPGNIRFGTSKLTTDDNTSVEYLAENELRMFVDRFMDDEMEKVK